MRHAILATLAAASLVLGTSGCKALDLLSPQVDRVAPRVAGLDLQGVDLIVDVDLRSSVALTGVTPLLGFGLDVDGHEVAAARGVEATANARDQRVSASVPVRVPYASLIRAIGALSGKTEVGYTVRGDVEVPLQGGSAEPFRIPWSTTGVLPVVKAPNFSGTAVEDPEIGEGGTASIAVRADILNPNGFEVNLDGLGYALEIGGVRIGALEMDSRGAVAAGASRRVALTGSVSAMDVLSGLFSGGRSSGVRVVAVGALRTPFGPVQLGD